MEGKQLMLDTISTFQILPTIFDLYNLKMPEYFEYLLELQQVSKGRSHNAAILDNKGEALTDMGSDQMENIYKELELLQYDYIYGNKFAEQLGMFY